MFPLFAFPGWIVHLNGKLITSTIDSDTGLIAVALPAGTSKVEIELGDMPQSQKGLIASVMAVIGLLLLFLLDFRVWKNGARTTR